MTSGGSEERGPIAVYGATGYTGRLVAAELARAGAELVLAGRNRAKLEIVAGDVGAGEVRAAALDDPAALRELLEPCAAVIACAGPFVHHGDPVLQAAIDTGTHYLDTTGEQPFIRRVFEHGPQAERAGICLLTAFGFDYVPGDMLAALTAAGLGELDEVVLAYATRGFGVSRGTARSAIAMLAGEDVVWRDGTHVPAGSGAAAGSFHFPPPWGTLRMIRYPAGEQITVPRHVATRNVRTLLSAATVAGHPRLAAVAPLAMPALALAMRSGIVARLASAAIGRLPEGPSPERRRQARFAVVCEAHSRAGVRRGVVTGGDVYGLTARIVGTAALRCAAAGFDRRGALAPAEAFEPQEFLAALGAGLEVEVEPL